MNRNPTFLFAMLLLLFLQCTVHSNAQVKILFDATKAEMAGNADWIIDADLHNLYTSNGVPTTGGSESNPQRIPTPAQSGITANTAEDYWNGGLSFWAVDCVKKGYTVETLPYNGSISYGNSSNVQDLSNYNVFIICEPNILFTAAEKTALLNFVNNGGGLFIIADHNISDRNNDGADAPVIWNDFFQNNSTGNTNPFGIIFDNNSISEISTKKAAGLPATDSIMYGPMGAVAKIQYSAGSTITINPTANASVKAVLYKNSVSSASGNNNVLFAYARYGKGKVAAIGDSSPCDDGTGDSGDVLYTGYNGDVTPNHRYLLMNATIWLATTDHITYTFTGNGNWNNVSNWKDSRMPPATLPAGDAILIDPVAGGTCLLNVTQTISAGASITVSTGKSLIIPGNLQIQ